MKNKVVGVLVAGVTILLAHPEPVKAVGPLTINGKWAGTAFASVIDLNGDGIGARTFDVKGYNQLLFPALQGVADTALIALPGQGSCTDPNAIELEPYGKITFRGHGNDALFTSVNATPHLCFNPASPNETLSVTVIGGTGNYQGRTGSGTLILRDIVLEAGPNGAPLVVDTQGDFSITIQ